MGGLNSLFFSLVFIFFLLLSTMSRLSRHSGPVYVEDSRLALSKDLPPQPSGSILEVLPADKV